ncbi:uncharacterized protein LOC116164156 [Photinus pyralis]|uniref:uncharacterized protein LOC116164156 n=1 Tax=Photinus pyralis TaxID=7054 RepID=UPI0012676D1B|nr:uncharacterized protein LOC116164156 [Photinus pyralis]
MFSKPVVNRGIVCGCCDYKIGRYDESIECAKCAKTYHINCVDLSIERVHELVSSNEIKIWECHFCIDGSSPPSTCAPETAVQQVTLDHIYALMITIKDNQDSFSKSLDACHDKIDDNSKMLQLQDKKIQDCLNKIEALEANNKNLLKENNELKLRVNDLEQYSRQNCIEIAGVPELKEENVLNTVTAVGHAIGFTLDKTRVDACHRLRKNGNKPNEPRGIIIKFVSRLDKEDMMAHKRVKRNMCVRDLANHG